MEAQRKEKERLKETLEENQHLVASLKEEIQMLRENEKKIKEQKNAAEHVSRQFASFSDCREKKLTKFTYSRLESSKMMVGRDTFRGSQCLKNIFLFKRKASPSLPASKILFCFS